MLNIMSVAEPLGVVECRHTRIGHVVCESCSFDRGQAIHSLEFAVAASTTT